MGQKLLAGAEIVPNWDSLGGALQGVLAYLGEPAAAPWVMGISGRAFRLALPIVDGEAAATGADAAFDPGPVAAAIRNLSHKVEILTACPSDPRIPKQREEAIRRIRKSVDRGIPAAVYDLQLPKFGLVKGYDDRASVWYVSTAVSGQYGETLPLARWPVPEQRSPLVVVLLDGRAKVDPRRAVRAALGFALTYAERGDPGDPSGAIHGLAAYVRWRQAFADGEPISPTGNATLVQTLQSARRDAAAFLRADAARLLPAAAPALRSAAVSYDAEALALSRMMTMFPYPSGGDPHSRASRLVAASALSEALAREQEAISALRAAAGSQQ